MFMIFVSPGSSYASLPYNIPCEDYVLFIMTKNNIVEWMGVQSEPNFLGLNPWLCCVTLGKLLNLSVLKFSYL